MYKSNGGSAGGLCGCMSLFLVLNLAIGGIAFNYCLWAISGHNIHWVGDVICGLILGELAIPLAIVFWILSLFGIQFPIF